MRLILENFFVTNSGKFPLTNFRKFLVINSGKILVTNKLLSYPNYSVFSFRNISCESITIARIILMVTAVKFPIINA